jgi:hypothetical protein
MELIMNNVTNSCFQTPSSFTAKAYLWMCNSSYLNPVDVELKKVACSGVSIKKTFEENIPDINALFEAKKISHWKINLLKGTQLLIKLR